MLHRDTFFHRVVPASRTADEFFIGTRCKVPHKLYNTFVIHCTFVRKTPAAPFRSGTVPSVTKGIVHHFQKSRKKRNPSHRGPAERSDFVCKRPRARARANAATARQKNADAKLNSPQCEASSPHFSP